MQLADETELFVLTYHYLTNQLHCLNGQTSVLQPLVALLPYQIVKL